MSLEWALEQERLEVLKLLEQQKKPARSSSTPAEARAGSKPNAPVSLLLNDEPIGNEGNEAKASESQDSERSRKPRTRSNVEGKRPSSLIIDSDDPFQSKDEYYYDADNLRKNMRGLNLSPVNSNEYKRGQRNRSLSPSVAINRDEYDDDIARNPFRRLSNKDLQRLDSLYSSEDKRLEKDSDDEEEESESSEERDDNDEDEEEEEEDKVKHSMQYRSLLDIDGETPKPSMAEYAAYKRRIIHPHTAFDQNNEDVDTPYTSNTEEIMDARKAASLKMRISAVHSNINTKRMVRSIQRGDLPSLSDPSTPRNKSYIVATDLSPEATHALEWTLGTVLRDGNILYVVCAFEDTEGQSPNDLEAERLEAMDSMTATVTKLLNKTPLQVHVFLEILHCKRPKHILTEIIDLVQPTLVILGSRGRSALKGVILGSFSNYVVERSSVPVMVARNKLHKSKNKGLNVRLTNNLRAQAGVHLSSAKVD
uniref:ARAD1D31306p n=1 Tax=Blastobotrys adeninivorans TaxID=409370 RepID=A0A060THI4_BLAAD